ITLNTVTTANGYIDIIANGHMTVNTVTAGGTGKNVYLTTTGTNSNIISQGDITALDDSVTLTATGSITDTTDINTRIKAGSLIIASAQDIGDASVNGRLDTEVTSIQNNRLSNNAYYLEYDDVILSDLESSGGSIDIMALGSIFGTHNYAGDEVSASKGLTLYAEGIIGTEQQPVWVDVPQGDIFVEAHSQINALSAHITSKTPFSYKHEPYDRFHITNTPPGLVLYNYRLMGGTNISKIKNTGYYAIDASANQNLLYPYFYQIISMNMIPVRAGAISDARVFGPHVLINIEDLGYSISKDKDKLIILENNLEILDLGRSYPPPPVFIWYMPFWWSLIK
ncbi:MAG: hypothetical protein KJ722_05930, partial [Candidatus Omnitrophica bacterium]|nr:hypothetical protein [Candidatus Omnitrophota bacterium]